MTSLVTGRHWQRAGEEMETREREKEGTGAAEKHPERLREGDVLK